MKSPVFVVGCPRSGTTWLGHLLMSSGRFATYRAETHFYDLFVPAYGSPRHPRSRRALADAWLASEYHRRTGIPASRVRPRLIAEGDTAGRFLDILMRETAAAQERPAWVDTTPAHALHMERIAAELPDARFLHVIRDGRDVALSLAPRGWIRTLPWDRGREVLAAGWMWERTVRSAAASGARLGDRYLEVRFENLVRDFAGELDAVERFLGITLDRGSITAAGIGSAREPNSSFGPSDGVFDPVGRWRTRADPTDLGDLEASIGPTLEALGYPLSGEAVARSILLPLRKRMFQATLALKSSLKNTPLGRLLVRPESAEPPHDPSLIGAQPSEPGSSR